MFGPPQKPWLWTETVLALLHLASTPLRNAAKSSVVPNEFAAEPTTKMESSKANFRLPPKKTIEFFFNFFFQKWIFDIFFSSSKLHFY